MLAPQCFGTYLSARKGTGAIDSVKDLVLEVPRLPLTQRDALFPISSPVARAASLEAYYLDATPCSRDSISSHATDNNLASR